MRYKVKRRLPESHRPRHSLCYSRRHGIHALLVNLLMSTGFLQLVFHRPRDHFH